MRESRGRRLGIGVVAACALAACAAAAWLPSLAASPWRRALLPAAISIATVALLRRQRRERRVAGRGEHAALALAALFATLSYFDFGRFHGGHSFVHDHEMFHYALGSKYYPELGHDGLYVAAQRALIDSEPSLAEHIPFVLNLREGRLEAGRISYERSDGVVARFSPDRWREFCRDVALFRQRIPAERWRLVLVDHGYNATPFWTALGSTLTARTPLTDRTLLLLALLDPLLLAGAAVLVGRCFDLRTALLFAIFVFTSPFAPFGITGGSLLRSLWFVALVAFAVGDRRGHPAAAGVALAIGTLDRIFPLLFALLPAVGLAQGLVRTRRLRGLAKSSDARLLGAFLGTVLLLGTASGLVTGGGPEGARGGSGAVQAWQRFFANIQAHESSFFINQLSVRTLFVVDPATSRHADPASWDESSWQRQRQAREAATRWTQRAVAGAVLLLLVGLLWAERSRRRALGLLSFAPFLLLYPANYYLVFLVPVVLAAGRAPRLVEALFTLQALCWLGRGALPSPLDMEFLHWLISLGLLLLFAGGMVGAAWRIGGLRSRGRHRVWVLGSACSLLLAAGIIGDLADPAGDRTRGEPVAVAPGEPVVEAIAFDLGPEHVREAPGLICRFERLATWGSSWSRDDHLLCAAATGAPAGSPPSGSPSVRASVALAVPSAARYRLRIDLTASPASGTLSIHLRPGSSLPGQAAERRDTPIASGVELFSPRVHVRTVVSPLLELHAGEILLDFEVTGRHPGSMGVQFGVDRVTLERIEGAGDPRADEALRAAVHWLLDHSADTFDGGRSGIAREIVALWRAAAVLRDTELATLLRTEIAVRLARLDRLRGGLLSDRDLAPLATAAVIARRMGVPFEGFDDARQAASRAGPGTLPARDPARDPSPLELATPLLDLQLIPDLASELARSPLSRERAERQLAGILRGPSDPNVYPQVAHAFAFLGREFEAITRAGEVDLPAGEPFERGFWQRFARDAARWARAAGDVEVLSRALAMAVVSGATPSEGALGDLLAAQEADGSFGPGDPAVPGARRRVVIAAIIGLATLPSEAADR